MGWFLLMLAVAFLAGYVKGRQDGRIEGKQQAASRIAGFVKDRTLDSK